MNRRWLQLTIGGLTPDSGPGPVVRPYALVRGRTKPRGEVLDVITMVYALRMPEPDPTDLEPEHLAVLQLCRIPMSVADSGIKA